MSHLEMTNKILRHMAVFGSSYVSSQFLTVNHESNGYSKYFSAITPFLAEFLRWF